MKYAIYSDGSYKNGIWGAGAVILQETPFGFNPVVHQLWICQRRADSGTVSAMAAKQLGN